MVTKQELVNGYETEIKYQRHMLENLGRWFSLLFITASIGVVLIYLFHKTFLPLLIFGILLALIGILGMVVLDMVSTAGGSISKRLSMISIKS